MSDQLTTVILDGPMGKAFGRKWRLKVNSPAEALRLIDANKPGLFNWVRANNSKYGRYRVLVDKEERDNDSFALGCKAKTIRFVPLIEGAAAAFRFVVGAIIFVASFFVPGMQGWGHAMGISLMVGAVVEWLTPTPKQDEQERRDKTSHYFDGPVNTERQGVPVPLIYGRILTGSHAVSVALTIDEIPVDA